MPRLSALCLLAVLSCLQLAHADDISGLGIGARPCKDWTLFQATGGGRAQLAKQWTFGFFSGYNAFGPKGRSPFLSYDEKNLVAFIDRECKAHPNERIADASAALIAGLEKTKKPYR